ncbi:MAG: methionine--tRNA ligase [Flavobacteriaceae bacterium]|nr:MAG: methionine--tRNA ligase [Flavobacteriaceae bacterium]
MPKRYTITAALPYANGSIHIGHLAGVYIPADIYARFLRLTGNEVAYICGSDEHGVAIPMRAKKEGVSPQNIINKYHKIIKQSFADFGISFDHYSRTSSAIHHQTASDFFVNLRKKEVFTEAITAQLYDAGAHQFLADRFVTGTCPKCGFEESYGDQCENCGTSHNATDIINPRSAITGNIPTVKETKHWFLPLDKYEGFLCQWILEGHKKDWKPNVYGQVKSWIEDGLKPRAVTRDLDWGIPVPVKNTTGKVLYVWFDAPIGYISATKEWAAKEGKNWEDYWKNPETRLVHFIGKDNIVFHCIIFPSMLEAHGGYILPDNVPANEFLNLEGSKLSTSKNWAVWLHEYLEDFSGQQDVLRYVLTANAPESKDNDFTWKDFQARNNNELVAIFGNFINRVVVLTNKYYHGSIPTPGDFSEADKDALASLKKFPHIIAKSITRYRFREASQEFMNLARLGNKYLADEEPWKVIKENEQRVQTIMYTALQIAVSLAVLSEPFLPFTSAKLKTMLNMATSDVADNDMEPSVNPVLKWEDISEKEMLLPAGHQIGKAALLFSKIEDKTIQAQLEKLKATKIANAQNAKDVVPQKETIAFDDFAKLDIRTGTVLEAKKIAKTKKLLQLKVAIGIDVRTIVSGIAESFAPEDIVGQQVIVLTNLAPRNIRGIESRGMILTAAASDGALSFVAPGQQVSDGQQIC